jgi:predicted Zn-ribbon and HTH transcriptional regulator
MLPLDTTTIGTLLALPAGVAAGALLIALWIAARRLRRGRAALVRPSCRRCGMTLRGEQDELPERCPECGETCTRDSGVVAVGFPRRTASSRWGWRIASAVLFLGALWVPIVMVAAPILAVHRAATIPAMPPRMAGVVMTDDAEKRMGQLLTEARTASGDTLRRLADETESLLAATPLRERLETVRVELLLHRIARDGLPLDEARRLADSFLSAPRAFADARVESGGQLLIAFLAPFNERDHWCRVRSILINGQAVQPPRWSLPTLPAPLQSLVALSVPVPTTPGPHTLTIHWDSDVLDSIGTRAPALGATAFGSGLRPRNEVTTLTFEVTSAPPEPPTLLPSDRSLFHYAYETPYLVLSESGERAAVIFAMPELPLRLGPGTMVLRIGHRTHTLRPLPASVGASHLAAYMIALVDRPAEGWPATAEVEFIPSDGATRVDAGRLPIVGAWRSRIIFHMRRWLTGDRQTNYSTERFSIDDAPSQPDPPDSLPN